MILDLVRKISAHAFRIRSGKWELAVPLKELFVLNEMTVGIVGFGRIGRAVAARLKPFRARVVVFDPVVDAAAVKAEGCTPVSFDELLQTSDLVTLHCPSNDKTQADDERRGLRQDEGGDAGQHLARHAGKDRRPGGALEAARFPRRRWT